MAMDCVLLEYIGTTAPTLRSGLRVGQYWRDTTGSVQTIKKCTSVNPITWETVAESGQGGPTSWGNITGTLSVQTDLNSALGNKEDANVNIQSHVTASHAPANAQANADITKVEIEAKLTGAITSHSHAGGSEAFPVGAVFFGAVATNPATLLGYGTWAQIGQGKFVVGQDSGDTDFDVAKEIGGEKTHTLTASEMPVHGHTQRRHATATGALNGWTTATDTSSSNPQDAGTLTTANAGGGSAHNNLPPYIVLYMWERTA